MRSGEAGPVDWKRTFLSLWRYAPEAPNPSLGALWRLLPADTRVPDHSIWEHLSLTSAFAGIFATNEEPALLALSLGPVQSFIAQARSTSDLWAGSHLLSTLSWEALRILADELGPDCVLLPNLHGLPVADVWLAKDLEVKPYWDQNAEPDDSDTETGADVEAPLCADLDPAPWRPLWRRRRTDANPLFVAAIPNRLVALVPATRASSIAERIRRHLREFLQDLGHRAWCKILEASAREATDTGHGSAQIARQLAELPELAWAAVPWSLVAGRAPLDVARLRDALAAFYPPEDGAAPGFLGSEAWKRFARQEIPQFSPNPGFLYPALYDLLDRALAASKATRPFAPAIERGFRCSLCGEREWLALSEDPLVNALPRGEAHRDDPWPAVAKKRPSWARRTEHLCAVCTTKRLWPSLFEEDLKKKGIVDEVRRYVVSTHALAVASSLARLCDGPVDATRIERLRTITSNVGETVGDLLEDEGNRAIALPRRLAARVAGLDRRDGIPLRDVPALLDELGDALRAIPTDGSAARGDRDVRSRLLKARDDFENALRGTDALGGLEDYYALVLMDGDRMGAWLSSLGAGDGALGRPRYEELWHPRIRNAA
ncbi:MAG TPA: type III-B CRISPR-associated protein Cas10/Cmr2, partial [Polyangiaceae bacterium]|nr:type III-B CRISPR-associated protein Cas10/Cmr2 [Polyangiaceae bacterium]